MAYVIKANGSLQEVSPANGNKFTLEEMQGYVDGNIQLVTRLVNGSFIFHPSFPKLIEVNEQTVMFVDEEGKLKGKLFNEAATMIFLDAPFDPIVGDALLCSWAECGLNESEDDGDEN